jgi:clan AA aspartic protease (TIGR02281 family)
MRYVYRSVLTVICAANATLGLGDELPDLGAAPAAVNAEKLQHIEALMDRYYRGKPIERARAVLNRSIQEHNQWVESARAELRATVAKLNEQVETIQELDKLTDDMDRRLAETPDRADQPAVDAYNALADDRNARVREYNLLIESHKRQEKEYRESRERHEREAETRKAEVEAQQAKFEQRIEEHKRWFKTGADVALFKAVNLSYAQVREGSGSAETPELAKTAGRLQAIRRELFEYTVASHQRAESGAVIVEATLCREQPCFLLVDTGAMDVTIPLSLVKVLGLSDRLGEEVTVKVAGGGKIRGRELIIPQLAVLGMEAEDVPAIVLDEFDAGVDGLLGLSYLKRFVVRIDQKHHDKITIEPSLDE